MHLILNFHKLSRLLLFIFALSVAVMSQGCRPARMVPEDKYLLKTTHIKGRTASVPHEDLEVFIRQKPNKKMLGIFRFRLMLYNMSGGGSGGRLSRWIATNAGEPPVIFDSLVAEKTRDFIENYLHNRGYYHARVSLTTKYRGLRSVKKYYRIDIGQPYTIRNIIIEIADSALRKIVTQNMRNSYVPTGELFDIEKLKKEQDRITSLIREEGYYDFSPSDCFFQADSSVGNLQADIFFHIANRPDPSDSSMTLRHRTFTIRNTYIVPNYDLKKATENKQLFLAQADVDQYTDSVFFLTHGKPYVKRRTLLRSDYIVNGQKYCTSDVVATQKKLANNKLIKLVRIEFEEVDSLKTDSTGVLDCSILLSPFTFQSYTVELEGSSTGGDYGAKVQFSYNHKNLFRGSENFSLNLTHSRKLIKTLDQKDNSIINIFNTEEYDVDTKIETPQFISPITFEKFQKNQSPNTILRAGYSYKHNLNFTSPQTYLSYGFSWRSNSHMQYIFTPSEISGVRYFNIDSTFREYINSNPYYRASYENYLITAMNFTAIFSDKGTSDLKSYSFHKATVETAGNLLNAFIENTATPIDQTNLGLLKTPQAQYLKLDYEFRFHEIFSETHRLVYRFIAGLAYPYGPRRSLPSSKQYYSGGLNSMRAWPSRTLGPGSYLELLDPNAPTIKYYLGDIKLEANAEYRFHMLWRLDGAFFVDAGNIWTYYADENRPRAQFDLHYALKDIAIGAGTGLRLDFSFFVFRLDTALKMRDPSLPSKNKWVMRNGLTGNDWNVSIGIGYPF